MLTVSGLSNLDYLFEHMGPGSHVGFPISTKNTNLVYDYPMNISAKFGSNLFVVSDQLNCGFAGMIIGWSCTKFVNRLLIRNSRWPP
jgi:hypothetical protein